MSTYTTTARVDELLPGTLPAAITSADKTRWVSDASAIVDGRVGARFPVLGTGQKFADITDSPATPPQIELCARWLGAYFGFVALREINKGKAPSQGSGYYKLAVDTLKDIREGKVDVYDATGVDAAGTTVLWSSTEDRDATFSRGVYEGGVLQGDRGTLDDFELAGEI